jgi:hypothetical protein
MSASNPTSIAIVVDTESYAGNFEREMCAFVTGQIGECGVGEDIAEEEAGSIRHLDWWRDHVVPEPDDNGCRRPASIWPTPGWFNNGLGGNYRDDPALYGEAADAGAEAMRAHHARYREQNEKAKAAGHPSWVNADIDAIRESDARKVAAYRERARRHPSHLSVAIFVDEVPPDDVMSELRERAALFASGRRHLRSWQSGDPLVVTGFRIEEPNLSPRP